MPYVSAARILTNSGHPIRAVMSDTEALWLVTDDVAAVLTQVDSRRDGETMLTSSARASIIRGADSLDGLSPFASLISLDRLASKIKGMPLPPGQDPEQHIDAALGIDLPALRADLGGQEPQADSADTRLDDDPQTPDMLVSVVVPSLRRSGVDLAFSTVFIDPDADMWFPITVQVQGETSFQGFDADQVAEQVSDLHRCEVVFGRGTTQRHTGLADLREHDPARALCVDTHALAELDRSGTFAHNRHWSWFISEQVPRLVFESSPLRACMAQTGHEDRLSVSAVAGALGATPLSLARGLEHAGVLERTTVDTAPWRITDPALGTTSLLSTASGMLWVPAIYPSATREIAARLTALGLILDTFSHDVQEETE